MMIFDSHGFIIQSSENPLVDRNDGGHITIDPKMKISTRQELSAAQAKELMRLTLVAGEAMTKVMNDHGVDIGRINYHDDGNWSVFKPGGPILHIHLYGRAKSAKHQPYGQSLSFPHRDKHPELYRDLRPLTSEDVEALSFCIKELLKEERYSDISWGLEGR